MTYPPYFGELGAVAGWVQMCNAGLRSFTTTVDNSSPPVVLAVHQDPDLTDEQRVALQELYVTFRDVNRVRRGQRPDDRG
jgi:hypothetical protein